MGAEKINSDNMPTRAPLLTDLVYFANSTNGLGAKNNFAALKTLFDGASSVPVTEFNTIADLLAGTTIANDFLAYVTDASGDNEVRYGWAAYLYQGGDRTLLASYKLMFCQAKEETIVKTVFKTAHGFTIGQVLTVDGSGNLVTVSDPVTEKRIGVVTLLTTANIFILTLSGYITGLTGLTPGSIYYAQSDGSLDVAVTGMPVLIADTATSGYMLSAGAGSGGTPTLLEVLTESNDGGGLQIKNTADPTLDTDVDTQGARNAAIAATIAALDVQVFKGVIDCSANPNYPAADAGWTYRVSVAGKIGGVLGIPVQINDILICTVDGSTSGDQITVGANWVVIHTNTDGLIVGPASAVDERIFVADGTTGKLAKDGGMTINDILAYADLVEQAAQQYADGIVGQLPSKRSVDVLRDTALPSYSVVVGTYTQLVATANGFFPTTDSILHGAILSVLVIGETAGNKKYNAPYLLTDGSAGTPWILTPFPEYQSANSSLPADMAEVSIKKGTVNALKKFQQQVPNLNVFVTDPNWVDITPATADNVAKFVLVQSLRNLYGY